MSIPPGMAKTMLHIYLSSLYHLLMEYLLLSVANTCIISLSQSAQWDGGWIVMVIVSTSQPIISLLVSHAPSPLSRLFVEMVSLQCSGSKASGGRKICSTEWNRSERIWLRLRREPCSNPINLLTKTSMYSTGGLVGTYRHNFVGRQVDIGAGLGLLFAIRS